MLMKKKIISLVMLLAMAVVCLPQAGTAVFAYSTGYPNTHFNSGDQIDDLIAVARTQVGYTQDSNGGTKYGAWYGKGTTNVAWCAMFVSWCADQAGISTSIIPKHADCDAGMKWFKSQGLWYNSACFGGSYTPQPGDIVYYSTTHSQTDATHVGIVTGVSGNYLQTIEGNTSADNKTYKVIERTKNANRTLNSTYILGYGTPPYETGEIAEPPAPPSNVKSDKARYTVGEAVVITWKAVADADSYWAYLWKDGKQLWYADRGSRTTMTCTDLTAGSYRVQIRSAGIFGYSDAAECTFTVSEREACAITAQPVNFVGRSGATATFTVKASGSNLTYQWQLSDDQGKTWRNSSIKTANYATTLSAKNDGRYVRCVVTDQYGNSATSNAASMSIHGPVITSQPADVTALSGSTVKLTVKANGSGLTYQWQLSDDKGKTWRNSSVKTANYYTTLTEKNNGRYLRCIVTDSSGISATSDAATISATDSTAKLAITAQPTDCIVNLGGTVTFTVKASGSGISYQWQLSDDAGANWRNSSVKTATYVTTLTNVNNGRYVRCIVTDKNGNSVTSNAARMRSK